MRDPPKGKEPHELGSALKVRWLNAASLLSPILVLSVRPLFWSFLASSPLLCDRWFGTCTTLLDSESQLIDGCLCEVGRGKGIDLTISHVSPGETRLICRSE